MYVRTNFVKKVEGFSLELVRLIRSLGIYPEQHPSIRSTAERVVALAPVDSMGRLTIGVTPVELIVADQFIGGKTGRLASLLHARKVLRVFWTKDVKSGDVVLFARLLSAPKLVGAELRRKLHTEGIYSIDFEPLELQQIHGKIEEAGTGVVLNAKERRRQAWMLLMSQDLSTEDVASALTTDYFWEEAKSAWSDLGYGDSEGFTKLVFQLGKRLEAALSLLSDGQRETVLDHMAKMGKTLSPQDLVRIMAWEGPEGRGIGPGVASLVREMDGQRFIDLLAGLAALGNQGSRRLLEVYRAFAPGTASEELLLLVRARLSAAQDRGFAIEVWKKVEAFILSLTEEAFMDAEYSKSLEDIADSVVLVSPEKESSELQENPSEHLDRVILALAGTGEEFWQKKLLERLETRIERLDVERVLAWMRLIDDVAEELLDRHPSLIRILLRRGLSSLSETNDEQRRALIEFSLRHEDVVLDYALKALSEERRISVRHFLVNLLSDFSPGATPTLISKARNSPWYLARNLAIVLGQQGLPQAIPSLKTLAKHPHPKVQKEALKALRTFQRSRVLEGLTTLDGCQLERQEKVPAASLQSSVKDTLS
jgi:hypothetical protein